MPTVDPKSPADEPLPQVSVHSLWSYVLTGLALAAIALVGLGSFTLHRSLALKAAQEQLALVSGLKVGQIAAWIDHEKSTALGLNRGMLMSEPLVDWLAGGPLSDADRTRIQSSLREMETIFGYRDVGILSLNGEPLMSSSGLLEGVQRYDKWVLANALLTNRPQLTSVRWDQDAATGTMHLDVLAPMQTRIAEKDQALAVLRLRIDPNRQLFALVQDWPLHTDTAETLITETQGADVTFLNELRHLKGQALSLRLPMNDPDLLGSKVARGAVDIPLVGTDYLEHKVLGMGRAIPGTQWHLIAKQDQSEVLRDLWTRTLMTSLIALGFVSVAFLSVRFWMKQRVAAQIQAELECQANTDRLTGLANRRSFDSHIHKELRRLLRHLKGNAHSGILAVAVIDVDHFKFYNDTYGHIGGDVCLRAVAEAIQGCIARPGDLACRFGGEEFILALPETDLAGALVVAEAARANVEKLALPHSASPVSNVVTVSVGVAASEVDGAFKIETLIEAADRALYAAKQQGRNRVVGHSALDVRSLT